MSIAANRSDPSLALLESALQAHPEIKGVHPACEALPELSEEEFETLAEDIRESGLANEILVDANGLLVDGRHRLVGCHLHGQEVRIRTGSLDLESRHGVPTWLQVLLCPRVGPPLEACIPSSV